MFARPVTKGFIPGWFAAEQDASLVIILDNSASMTAIRNGKSYLDISKNEMMAYFLVLKKKLKLLFRKHVLQKLFLKDLILLLTFAIQ